MEKDGTCTSEMVLERDALRRIEERTGFKRPSDCFQDSLFFLEAQTEGKTPIQLCPHRNNGCMAKVNCQMQSVETRDFFSGKIRKDARSSKKNFVKDMGGI